MCPIGNPVKPGFGEKVHDSLEYANAQGMKLIRSYRSWGSLTPAAELGWVHQPMGGKWKLNVNRRLTPVIGAGNVTAIQSLSDRELVYFGPSGKVIESPKWETGRQLLTGKGAPFSVVSDKGIEQYDREGRLLTEIDLRGRRLNYIYSDGRPTKGIDKDGVLVEELKLPPGLLVRIENREETTIYFGYDGKRRLTAVLLPNDGRLFYEYEEEFDNLTKVIFPDESFEKYHYDVASEKKYPGLLAGIIDGKNEFYAEYAYSNLGQAVRTSNVDDIEQYQFDYGRISWGGSTTKVIDPIDTHTLFSFGHYGNKLRHSEQYQSAGAGSKAVNKYYRYDDPDDSNLVTRIIDFNAVPTIYTHDPERKLEIKRVKGSGQNSETVHTQWHPLWPLKTAIAKPGLIQRWIYNGEIDPTSGKTASCAGGASVLPDIPLAVVCAYIEQPTSDASGGSGFGATFDGVQRKWQYTYDGRGNLLTSDGPRTDVNDVTTYTYWPVDALCPGAGERPGQDKGCRGQLYSMTNALGHTTHFFKYDANGNLMRMRDPNGVESVYFYDINQRLIQYTHDGLTTDYQYDARGLLVKSIINADNREIDYEYDKAHRLIGIKDNHGNRIRYTLDKASNITKEEVIDPSGKLRWILKRSFDPLSRVATEVRGN